MHRDVLLVDAQQAAGAAGGAGIASAVPSRRPVASRCAHALIPASLG